jgi:hypothetical protein
MIHWKELDNSRTVLIIERKIIGFVAKTKGYGYGYARGNPGASEVSLYIGGIGEYYSLDEAKEKLLANIEVEV